MTDPKAEPIEGCTTVASELQVLSSYLAKYFTVMFTTLTHRDLALVAAFCVGENGPCSPVHSDVYIMRICVIFATLWYYYLLINVNSHIYICRIRAIWRILLTIVDYW